MTFKKIGIWHLNEWLPAAQDISPYLIMDDKITAMFFAKINEQR